jgi:hypothetical protein
VVSALSAVVTREGRLVDLHRADDGDRREIVGLMDAVSAARFRVSRAGGSSRPVNMVWIMFHTNVRGRKTVS